MIPLTIRADDVLMWCDRRSGNQCYQRDHEITSSSRNRCGFSDVCTPQQRQQQRRRRQQSVVTASSSTTGNIEYNASSGQPTTLYTIPVIPTMPSSTAVTDATPSVHTDSSQAHRSVFWKTAISNDYSSIKCSEFSKLCCGCLNSTEYRYSYSSYSLNL